MIVFIGGMKEDLHLKGVFCLIEMSKGFSLCVAGGDGHVGPWRVLSRDDEAYSRSTLSC